MISSYLTTSRRIRENEPQRQTEMVHLESHELDQSVDRICLDDIHSAAKIYTHIFVLLAIVYAIAIKVLVWMDSEVETFDEADDCNS